MAFIVLPDYPVKPLDVPCPRESCLAGAGSPCETFEGRRYGRSYVHQERGAALAGAQRQWNSWRSSISNVTERN